MRFHTLAIDFESSGVQIESRKHQPISCGVILVDDTLAEIDRLYVECAMEDRSEWTMAAEKCHGLSYDYIMQQQSMAEAATKIFEFLVVNGVKSDDYLILCGHNVDFDINCLQAWFNHINVSLRISHRKIDTFPLGFGLFGATNSDELFKHVGVERDAHNALEDADAALNAFRKCRLIGNAWAKFGDRFVD